MEEDVTAKLSKVDMNEAEAAAALASALSYALSGIDLIPRIIRSQGEDGIPLVEAYQTMMAESIFDAMMAIGMGKDEIYAHVGVHLASMEAITRSLGGITIDDAY